MLRSLRPVLVCLLVAAPAVVVRALGLDFASPVGMLVFGGAIVAASFVLAWAAEAAEVDISGGLAVAILAVIAVLPEYAVDLFFAYRAGGDPAYVQYAAANMTGSNRLLLGLGWSLVVLVSVGLASRQQGRTVREVVLDASHRLELGFLAIASLIAFVIPATGMINLIIGAVMLGLFVFYLIRVGVASHGGVPELVGPAARIGGLPKMQRRPVVVIMFMVAAIVICLSAEPFAESLIGTGATLGIDQFLLVQWLAPLASEAPEFIVAVIFAVRGKAGAALGILISAKVNQWTLLIGSLPIAYLIGGGSGTLQLDGRQTEEVLLTACQTVLGLAILIGLRFPRWAAVALLVLFAVQFAIPGTTGRLIISAVYLVVAIVVLVLNRHHIAATLAAPFRRAARSERAGEIELVTADR